MNLQLSDRKWIWFLSTQLELLRQPLLGKGVARTLQISKMESLATIVNGFQLLLQSYPSLIFVEVFGYMSAFSSLNIVAKLLNLNVCGGPENFWKIPSSTEGFFCNCYFIILSLDSVVHVPLRIFRFWNSYLPEHIWTSAS